MILEWESFLRKVEGKGVGEVMGVVFIVVGVGEGFCRGDMWVEIFVGLRRYVG